MKVKDILAKLTELGYKFTKTNVYVSGSGYWVKYEWIGGEDIPIISNGVSITVKSIGFNTKGNMIEYYYYKNGFIFLKSLEDFIIKLEC